MKTNDKSRVQKLEHVLAAIGAGLLFIACLALWGNDACYYDGIKLNFKEGYDAPAED